MSVPMPDLQWIPAPCYSTGRQGNPVRNITFHHACSSALSAVNWFKNPNSQTSSHFIIGPNTIYCMVDTDDTAWTNGNWQSNLQSVTIEHEGTWLNGFRDENVINKSVELVAWLIDLYPSATPNRHRDVAATACPGDLPVEEIWNKALARREAILHPAPPPAPVPVTPEWLKNRVPLVVTKYIARDGVQLLDLTTLKPADARVFGQNMKIDIGSKTTVGGKDYFITVYSTGKNIAAGYLGTDLLDTPYSPPPPVVEPPDVIAPDAGQYQAKVNWLVDVMNAIINFFKSLSPFK
jgi:hypothetical protein